MKKTRTKRGKRVSGRYQPPAFINLKTTGTPENLLAGLFPSDKLDEGPGHARSNVESESGASRLGTLNIGSLRMLVVDDDPFQRAVLGEMLRSMGVQQVSSAANGKEALALLRSNSQGVPVDVVTCDLYMPEMDGIELLRALALEKLTRGVIIISGREADILRGAEAMVRALGLAILGRLKKPVQPEQLRSVLERPLPLWSSSEPDVLAIDRTQLLRALREGEFYPVFQPKVKLATRQLDGVEALARWARPDAARVLPMTFVPALTREGLITPLADLMLEESCRALKSWQEHGLTLAVAVNVSMTTLSDLEVTDRFERIVRQYGLDPGRITLEVTETEVMADAARVLHVLSRLRLKGFRLAIDDFGTGYSSLQQLNMMPFTELKIDQVFVRNCGESRRLRKILESSIELAHSLGIPAVAEGVESESEWQFLHSKTCDEAQGFFITRPLPQAEIPRWAAAWHGSSSPDG
jgi:EAL domain-containing protein (putative c-di-GMP-specific phosphodiesterase class I)/AmiR/NasT family two-component response regulator